jgi:hypothetical protein
MPSHQTKEVYMALTYKAKTRIMALLFVGFILGATLFFKVLFFGEPYGENTQLVTAGVLIAPCIFGLVGMLYHERNNPEFF